MRLIDAELIETLGVAKYCDDCPYSAYGFCGKSSDFVNACEAITDAPTVEPQQAIRDAYKHGKSKGIKRGMAMQSSRWIPCSERMPEEAYPVIVTWKNDDPASYYQYILGKHYVGVAHYKNGKWFWYSSTTEDVLMEYGRCDSEEFDEAINVVAWMPLPEPWKGEE